jgi:uroporphyrinogen decarboxylase
MTQTMTAGERVHAALRGEHVDRVPFCFWHHFREEAQGSGERLAAATLDFFYNKFHLDIVKIMPDLPYPVPATPLTEAAQWRDLPRLGLDTPIFQEQLICIRTLRAQLGPDYPLIVTQFSPVTHLLRHMGMGWSQAMAEARRDPDSFTQGLSIIAANLRDLMRAEIDAGASGVFYSCMAATSADFTREEYMRLGRPADLQALEGVQAGWLNVIHIHADPSQTEDEIHFDLFTDYPVQVLSWSDRLTGPSLSEALTMTDKCLMGGLSERGPLVYGGETELDNEIMGAVTQTKGRRLILANGCSIPDDTSEHWLTVARRLVDNLQ